MAAPIRPAGTSAFGHEKWIYVASVANMEAVDLSSEVGGADSLDLTGYFYADGFDGPGADTSRVTAPRRLLDQTLLSKLGATTHTFGDLLYSIDPQAAALSNAKKAYEKLVPGSDGVLLWAPGVEDPNDDLVAGDFVIPYAAEFGPQIITRTSTGEEGEFAVRQAVSLTAVGPLAALVA